MLPRMRSLIATHQSNSSFAGCAWIKKTRFNDSSGNTANVSNVAERGDASERLAHRGPWRAAYWPMLGGSTPNCAPGDRGTASAFLARIETAIDRGGWTHNEWRNLHKLRERWSLRASGRDTRFDFRGTRGGRLERGLEAFIRKRINSFKLSEYCRAVQNVQVVNAADPRVTPSKFTLRGRRRQARIRQYGDSE